MSSLFLDPQKPFVSKDGRSLSPEAWRYLKDLQNTLTTIDLSTQVTGVLPGTNGGTGINNGTKSLTLGGAFTLTLTQTANTNVTLPNSGTLVATTSPVTAVNLNVTTGVAPDSGAIKHKRVTTGSVGAGATTLVTVTWGTAFPDANYTATASVVDATTAVLSLSIVHIESIAAGAVTVRVQNTSLGALTGTVQVIALHD